MWKVDLASKLKNDIILVGNLSNSLINKDIEQFKLLLIKINRYFHKKIIVIDDNVELFYKFAKRILVLKGKKVIYNTSNIFDKKLYEYIDKPEILKFIDLVNVDKKILNNNIEIYELIKDIYRSVS